MPDSSSAPRSPRIRKSPRAYSGLFSSITIPSRSPCAAIALSSKSSSVIASLRRSSAGLLASSSITFPSAAVTTISGPIGRAPCDTQGRTSTPRSATPTAPSVTTSSPRISAPSPGPPPALASPPTTGSPGCSSPITCSSGSTGHVYASSTAGMPVRATVDSAVGTASR